MSSESVYALLLPPCDDKYAENSSSLGNFLVPRKLMCSQKCARPGTSLGSEKAPTFTSRAAALLLDDGSLIKRTLMLLSSSNARYNRSSKGLFLTSLPDLKAVDSEVSAIDAPGKDCKSVDPTTILLIKAFEVLTNSDFSFLAMLLGVPAGPEKRF